MIENKRVNIKFEIKDAEKYAVTADGRVFNQQTGKELKRCLIGLTPGYCINGKFKSLKQLRKRLIKPQKIICPF